MLPEEKGNGEEGMARKMPSDLIPEELHLRLHEHPGRRVDPAFLGLLLKGLMRHGSERERCTVCDAVDHLDRDTPHDRLTTRVGISRGRRYSRQAERRKN